MYVNGVINISMNRSDQSMENIANHPQIEGSSVIAMRGNVVQSFFLCFRDLKESMDEIGHGLSHTKGKIPLIKMFS